MSFSDAWREEIGLEFESAYTADRGRKHLHFFTLIPQHLDY